MLNSVHYFVLFEGYVVMLAIFFAIHLKDIRNFLSRVIISSEVLFHFNRMLLLIGKTLYIHDIIIKTDIILLGHISL